MSRDPISRRLFLTLPWWGLLAPLSCAAAEAQRRHVTYTADIGILYDFIKLQLTGTIDESVDIAGGRYDVKIIGRGSNIANRVESAGRLIDDRWAPVLTSSWFQVRGREARSEINYDYAAKKIRYTYRGETFFMRHLRVVDDSVLIPPGHHVDDVVSAMLNYAENRWPISVDGQFSTELVRRRKKEDEGPDDVERDARAELISFRFATGKDATSGKTAAEFDMAPFSSWARRGEPGRIVFGLNRRPELITSSLILGTSVTIRLLQI